MPDDVEYTLESLVYCSLIFVVWSESLIFLVLHLATSYSNWIKQKLSFSICLELNFSPRTQKTSLLKI